MKLEECRNKINSIDDKIVALLSLRAKEVKKIGLLKTQAGLPIIDNERENEILKRICVENDCELNEKAIANIFGCIILESRKIQMHTAEQKADHSLRIT